MTGSAENSDELSGAHWAEALQGTLMVASMFDEFVADHPATVSVQSLRTKAETVSELLHELYQDIGREAIKSYGG